MNRDNLPSTIGLGLAVLAVVAGLWWLITYRREVDATVTHTRWMRAIQIEQWTTVDESDWAIPSGGRKTREYLAIHHWERYQSSSTTECQWRGTGKDRTYVCESEPTYSSRPVWATRYDYQIERWLVVRTPQREGVDTEPVWPDVSDLRSSPAPAIGDQRAGRRTERYTVDVLAGRKPYAIDVAEGQWATLRHGQACRLVLNVLDYPVAIQAKG